jgi:hypothetical protein
MSRLFYDKTLLITGGGGEGSKDYLEKVAKLIPTEIIAAYVALLGFVPLIRNGNLHGWFYWAIFLFCSAMTPIYLNWQAEKDQPKKRHTIISTAAFVIWAYSVSGATVIPGLYDAAIGSILLVVFSLISGKIPLRGPNESPQPEASPKVIPDTQSQ